MTFTNQFRTRTVLLTVIQFTVETSPKIKNEIDPYRHPGSRTGD